MIDRKYGALESPNDIRDFRVSAPKSIELPVEFRLNHTTIKDQGDVNSCVAHTLSEMLESKYKNNYSTGWIYGYRPTGYYQGEGMYPREALSTLLKKGAVLNKDFNVNIEMSAAKKKVDDNIDVLEIKAEDTKIESYARMSTINEIKTWLYTKNIPVPIAIATDNLVIDSNNIIQIPDVYPNSGHAILIIGWNETGFIIQNSWGTNWGDNGLAILPYEYKIREAWAVTMDTSNREYESKIKKPCLFFLRSALYKLIKFVKGDK